MTEKRGRGRPPLAPEDRKTPDTHFTVVLKREDADAIMEIVKKTGIPRATLVQSIVREYIERRSENRSHYDTPSSIKGCQCDSCKRYRAIHTKGFKT